MADKAKERRRGGRVTVLRRRIFLIAVLTMAMLFGVAVGINLYILHLNEDANRSSNQSDLRMVHSFLQTHQNGLRAILHSVLSDADLSTITILHAKETEESVFSYRYTSSLQQKLELLCSVNQDISSLFIVLPQADIVVSEKGTSSLATFFQANRCAPLRDWAQEPSAMPLGIFRGTFYSLYYNEPSVSGQYHLSASNGWASAVLLLSQDNINNKLARQFAGREMSLYVLTEENELYGWYEPGGTPLTAPEVRALYEQGTVSTTVNGGICDAYYTETGALRVVCLFRQDAIRQAFRAGYLLLGVMLAAFCALACGLYFAMVHWFYTPINNLLAVYGTEDSLGEADEYGRISRTMDSLRRDIASLEQRMRDSDRKAQEETRNRLRTMFPEEAAAVPGAYAVFSLVMENAEGVFQDSLCRKVCLSLSEVLETTVLYDHSASFTGVFGLRTETLPVERLVATLKAVAGEGNYVRMGVSAIYTDRRFLADAYEEARGALESPAPGWVIVHDAQAASAVPSRFHVPLVKQAELASRLAEGDWALVCATLDDIYAENEGLNRYWQCRLSGYLMDLCLVLASNHPIDSVQMLCYHERQAASHNPELLRRRVYERYERLCEALRPGAEELAERMKRYIEKHLDNPELTLNDVAEHLNRSYSYVSACFSKTVGMPFTVYLQKRRVATAMRLLAETEESVAQVARLVGYELTGSFIRLFKKEIGMTPGQYRDSVAQREK